jgi:general secretion pathway protein G
MLRRQTSSYSGFTLIELLIVVAIIAILAAIAVPNFLEAQTRAKISAIKANMRTVATALEIYFVDHNHYVPEGDPNTTTPGGYPGVAPDASVCLIPLTTPISYLTSIEIIKDPFQQNVQLRNAFPPPAFYPYTMDHFFYVNYEHFSLVRGQAGKEYQFRGWGMSSLGSDRKDDGVLWAPHYEILQGTIWPPGVFMDHGRVYDPTNGTVSDGDIALWGGTVTSEVNKTLSYVNQ